MDALALVLVLIYAAMTGHVVVRPFVDRPPAAPRIEVSRECAWAIADVIAGGHLDLEVFCHRD